MRKDVNKFIDKNKVLLKQIFWIVSGLSIIGYFIWAYLFTVRQQEFDIVLLQIVLMGLWVNITVILTLHELLFTRKVLKQTILPLVLIFLSVFFPIVNIIVFLPIAYYLIIKNMKKVLKNPKVYGGFALSLLSLGFATVTLIKSIEVYIMSVTGVI